MKAAWPDMYDREIQGRTLDRTSRFERAVTRVLLPTVHYIVPYHFSGEGWRCSCPDDQADIL